MAKKTQEEQEKLDLQKLLKLSIDREKCIKEANSKLIRKDYASNIISQQLHPTDISVQVKEIKVESPNTKSFVLAYEGDFPLYQEGQYITLDVPIDGVIYHRPFTISCSSKRLRDHEIQITVKRLEHGLISNYFFYQVNVGDYFHVHGPFGHFTYQSIRDGSRVLGLAGGIGIAPFKAMAEAICDGILDFDLTILYGASYENDLIFKNEFDEMAKKNKRIQVIYFLSEENKEGYESGFITKETIMNYQKDDMSYFVCGPTEFYESMNTIFKELNIANKYIRHDVYDEYEKGTSEETYEIRVLTGGREKIIFGKGNESILKSLEREGIQAPSRCGVGVCGYCRSKLIDGEVLTSDKYVRAADQKYHYIHPCQSYPLSNLTIKLPK